MSIPMTSFERPRPAEDVAVAVPLAADLIAALRVAVFQRRSLGDNSAALADLVEEAVSQWLEREIDNTTQISIRV